MKMKITFLLVSILSVSSLCFAEGGKKDTTINRLPKSSAESSTQSTIPSTSQQTAAAGTPTRAVQDLELKTDNYKTGNNLTAVDRAKNAQIKHDAITGTFDLRELCRLALDKHWGQRSAAEQNEFVTLMTQLLETKAILSKEQSKTQGKKYTIKYLGESYLDPQKAKAKTKTIIYIPKENTKVAIDYKLIKMANGWKVFDIIVDDASLVDNYKFQFDSIIAKYGYPELVSRMKKKLTEFETPKS